MEILSEHCCEGWLEGYLLSGRHGVFACYEAFIGIIDTMMGQYAKWQKMAADLPWRKPVASLNYLLTSHVWEQDHNGYSHQGPTFINMMLTKKASEIRIYLPPDANCLLSVMDHCLRSEGYVNLIVASKKAAMAVAGHGSGVGSTARAAPRSGNGPPVRANRISSSPLPATCPRARPSPPHSLLREAMPALKYAW